MTATGKEANYLDGIVAELKQMKIAAVGDGHDFLAHLLDLAAEEARELQIGLRAGLTRNPL